MVFSNISYLILLDLFLLKVIMIVNKPLVINISYMLFHNCRTVQIGVLGVRFCGTFFQKTGSYIVLHI